MSAPDLLAMPSGEHAWMLRRDMNAAVMNWLYPEDDADPITADWWDRVVAMVDAAPLGDPPPLLVVAKRTDETLVELDAATHDEKLQAVRTAMVTACRLFDAMGAEVLTVRALLADLEAGEAG
jgi:hypothetical protein